VNPLRAALAAAGAAVALLCVPSTAGAVNPPPCDTSVYPVPFLVIDGTTVTKSTRWIELVINPKTAYKERRQADVLYPFPLTINRSLHGSHTYQVHDYARDQFGATFAKGETAHVTTTYVEDHTEYSIILGTYHVQCSRTVSADFKRPKQKKKKKHHEDDQNQGEEHP